MSEEKNKNKQKKDDCPLCRISPETIAALKKAKKVDPHTKSSNGLAVADDKSR